MSKPKTRRIPKLVWFVVAAVLMVVLWVFLAVWLPYHREQVAIREIETLGGAVAFEWDGPDWMRNGPEWLQEKIDDGRLSWFNRVIGAILLGPTDSDEGLIHLRSFTNLKELGFKFRQVSDEGLEHLGSLTNLETLWFEDTEVSEAGLKHLCGLNNLKELRLRNTRISDEGLKHISRMSTLNYLYLENTQVTDESAIELQKALPNCIIHYLQSHRNQE